jgi:hypothetical protein
MSRIASVQVFLLMLLTLLLAACGSDTEPQTRIFDLDIAGGSLDGEHTTLRVDHNDEVVLRITSDQEATFHLHGYNLEASLMPGETASLAFTANATGKFDFEMHAASADHEGDGHSHDSTTETCTAELPPGAAEPRINLSAMPGSDAGELRVMVDTENFVLGTEPDASGMPVGHWHLFVDGDLKGMYTAEEAMVMLSQGEHDIMATLSDPSHCGYDVQEMQTVMIEEGATMDHEDDQQAPSGDILLGSLEVHPR